MHLRAPGLRRAKEMLADLARYLLRAVISRPGEVHVEHVLSGQVDFLFLRLSGHEGSSLSARDREAVASVIEAVGARSGRTVIVDWR
ncbi:MAG: hypothetical protein BIP78_0217 [Candidatus Bipolaricaulis sibiricus]|uniref:Uncharacterized protein n=1 Tax=Bipolaricaulis sibiricus TaxID=2501609 RepID=A0A410FSB2_BIPS1|nr:MAG: hypothetical protein BIP78_0217 [Candidatus Bipolaricaulis sibiricus]